MAAGELRPSKFSPLFERWWQANYATGEVAPLALPRRTENERPFAGRRHRWRIGMQCSFAATDRDPVVVANGGHTSHSCESGDDGAPPPFRAAVAAAAAADVIFRIGGHFSCLPAREACGGVGFPINRCTTSAVKNEASGTF